MSQASPAPAGNASALSTLATTLYDRLRADLLAGKLEPGRKLQIEFLSEQYGSGLTPVREALNRLTSDGLVERRDQRGFAVTSISATDLIEITKTRCWLEEIAVRESIAAHAVEWEEKLVLAFHRLTKTPRSLAADHYEANPEWERLHRAFHHALIGGCGSRWLLLFCEQLADQLYRYRQLAVRKSYRKRHEQDEHQAIMNAALHGEADQVVAMIKSHYRATADIILSDATLFSDLPAQLPVDWDAPRRA